MRLFLGLFPPPKVKEALVDLTKLFSTKLPIRWVAAGQIHATLIFFPEIDEGLVELLSKLSRKTIEKHSCFELTLGGPGVFPHPQSPRVLWLDLTGEATRLRQLQRDLETTLLTAGLSPETKRAFRPHFTLGRFNQPLTGKHRHRLLEIMARLKQLQKPESFRAEKILLVRSDLGSAGPTYQTVAEFSLLG